MDKIFLSIAAFLFCAISAHAQTVFPTATLDNAAPAQLAHETMVIDPRHIKDSLYGLDLAGKRDEMAMDGLMHEMKGPSSLHVNRMEWQKAYRGSGAGPFMGRFGQPSTDIQRKLRAALHKKE